MKTQLQLNIYYCKRLAKQLSAVLLLTLLVNQSVAANANVPANSKPVQQAESEATNRAHKQHLQAKLRELSSYTADFQQVVMDITGEVLQEANGRIHLQQPQKLHWEVYPPNEAVLIADGNTLWHVDPFVEQVIALDQTASIQAHPMMLLAQPDSPSWQHYAVSAVDNVFTVIPQVTGQASLQDPALGVKKLQLTFSGATLNELLIIDEQQQSNLLTFSNVSQNQPIAAEKFQFSLPDGFDLDDQR